MDLVHEQPDYEYVLRGADGRSALVNDRQLRASFIISPTQLREDWAAAPVASLEPDQLEPLLALGPEVILLGTGEAQAFPPPRTMAACTTQGPHRALRARRGCPAGTRLRSASAHRAQAA